MVEGLKRLVLQGADSIKMGEQMEVAARDAGYELKQDYMWVALEALAPEIKASTLAELAVGVESPLQRWVSQQQIQNILRLNEQKRQQR